MNNVGVNIAPAFIPQDGAFITWVSCYGSLHAGGYSLGEPHPRARSARVCCKPIIGFVPLECMMNVMLCNNQRKVT